MPPVDKLHHRKRAAAICRKRGFGAGKQVFRTGNQLFGSGRVADDFTQPARGFDRVGIFDAFCRAEIHFAYRGDFFKLGLGGGIPGRLHEKIRFYLIQPLQIRLEAQPRFLDGSGQRRMVHPGIVHAAVGNADGRMPHRRQCFGDRPVRSRHARCGGCRQGKQEGGGKKQPCGKAGNVV